MTTQESTHPATTVVRCRVVGRAEPEPIEFDGGADVAEARRWLANMRRIDRVEAERRDGRWVCWLRGVGHRIPVRRRISLPVALGLAAQGIPVVASTDTVETQP